MRKLVGSVENYSARKGIEVTLADRLADRSMPMDGEKLERIMLNLLSNSIKHTGRGGRIGITLEGFDDRILISVEDNGEGIPSDKQGMVFDRFSQVNTSLTRSSEGTGIGLALSKSLVELLQGRIWFESAFGAGTTFHVELPILPSGTAGSLPVTDSMALHRKVEMEFSDIL